MKRYIKEISILLVHILMFYTSPLLAGPTDAMGMVFMMLIGTFALSILIGSVSKEKVKYSYPIVIAILFIPSVFIYYNETAMVHSLWYLVVSLVGIAVGAGVRWLIRN